MQRNGVLYRVVLAATFALCLSGYVQSEPANLDLLRQKIESYHDSGKYNRDINHVAEKAIHFINERVAQNRQREYPKKLAIVLDIDETSLSNYNDMLKRNFFGDKAQLIREIHAAKSPAIQPILKVYHDAVQHGVAVFFVTGRHGTERRATLVNLKRAGFNQWDGVYFKPDSYAHKSVIPYKSHARETIAHKGYTIIASIGDQRSDLVGGFTEATFKLPNPFYFLP